MIKLDCPACKNPLKGPDEFAGKSPRCPICRTRVLAPEIPAAPVEAATKESPVDELIREARSAEAKDRKSRAERVKKEPRPKPIDASPRKQRRHLATGAVIASAAGILLILIAGIIAFKYVTNATRQRSMDHLLVQADLRMTSVVRAYEESESHLKAAREAMEEKNYQEAAAAYAAAHTAFTSTNDRLKQLRDYLEQGVTRYPDLHRDGRYSQMRDKVNDLGQKISSVLTGEELEKGQRAGELVLFEGKWVAPEEYQKLYGDRMRELGMVQYQGEWMTHDEAQRRRGLVLYQDRWITKEQYEAIRAQEEARQAALEERRRRDAEEAARRAEESRLRLDRFPPAGAIWVVDDLATPGSWTIPRWGNTNPLNITYEKRNDRNALKLDIGTGREDKAAIQTDIGADFSSRKSITVSIENLGQKNASVALACQTNDFYESRAMPVRPGANEVVFDLTTGDWKCERSRWQHTSRLEGRDHVARMFILIYGGTEQTYYITNIYSRKID